MGDMHESTGTTGGVRPRFERHDLHGRGAVDCEVYDMPATPDHPWSAVTAVPCPVPGCGQTVVWYEAGYVPGYRVCVAPREGGFDAGTIRHRFLAGADLSRPTLIRDGGRGAVRRAVRP